MDDELNEIFAAGATAAGANGGAWHNPHLKGLVAAEERGEPVGRWREKLEAWEQGREWQLAKSAAAAVPLH